jgi:ABC-type uncharacterized transport system substrate-binding protein
MTCISPLTLAKDATQTKRIFIIFSYPIGQWTDGITEGLTNGLKNRNIKHKIRPYVYHYDFFENKPKAEIDVEINKIVATVKGVNPDYIVVCDDEAADALITKLYPLNIPIIFTGVNKEKKSLVYLKGEREKITGVFESYPIKKSLKLLADLTKNKVKNISIITSQNKSSRIIVNDFKNYFSKNTTKIKLDKIYELSKWSEWKETIPKINKESGALWMLVPWSVRDDDGNEMDLRIMGEWLAKNITIPSISIVDISLHMGVMASISVTPQILGDEVANIIGTNINNGVPINKIPYQYPDRCEIIINKAQADKLKIKIPIDILEYAKIIKKPELKTHR